MFIVPGFNPSVLSDDDLMKKQLELHKRLAWASRFGSGEACDQLNAMILSIDTERRDRVLRIIYKERDKYFPEIIESDPEMAATNKVNDVESEKEKEIHNRRKANRDRMITKTSAPIAPILRKSDTSTGDDNG